MSASDGDVVRAVRRGDSTSFGQLVERYQRRLFGLVLMVVRQPAGAEEVTQDTFIRAFTHLERYDDRQPFYPWQCATCGLALKAATALTAELAALPQPQPPRELVAVVLARIARIQEPRPVSDAAVGGTTPASLNSPKWPAWATVSGGVVATLALISSTFPSGGASIEIASFSVLRVTANLLTMSLTPITALMLVIGLAIYVAGLLAPLREHRP